MDLLGWGMLDWDLRELGMGWEVRTVLGGQDGTRHTPTVGMIAAGEQGVRVEDQSLSSAEGLHKSLAPILLSPRTSRSGLAVPSFPRGCSGAGLSTSLGTSCSSIPNRDTAPPTSLPICLGFG